jgi:hypothetical protein
MEIDRSARALAPVLGSGRETRELTREESEADVIPVARVAGPLDPVVLVRKYQ